MRNELSTRIFELRKENNLSQKELALKINVSQKAIDFWEKGINEPKASYIILLANVFGVTADYLLGLED